MSKIPLPVKLLLNPKCMYLTDAKKKKKTYKCPDCSAKYDSLPKLYVHVEEQHKDNIPEGVGVDQYVFNRRNNKEYGVCVICKQNKTEWNSDKCRYERYCSPECKAKARAEWEKNFKAKHGTTNPMNDPEYQAKLQEGRSISKKYQFPDGVTINCMGTYEYDFIEHCVEKYKLNSTDVTNCKEVFYYEWEGEQKFYMPDFYFPEINLIVEIKDGGDNPNKHPKIQEVDKIKEIKKDQAIIDSKQYNYCKVVNKEYKRFDEIYEFLTTNIHCDKPVDVRIIEIPD